MIRRERKLNRLPGYDYSLPGWYFVTTCTHNRRELFGCVKNGKMELNNFGNIVHGAWQKIPKHYKNVEIDEFVVMPNHIHGIVNIFDRCVGAEYYSAPTSVTRYGLLSKIVKSFKHVVTQRIRIISGGPVFPWQRSFHDRIICNDGEYHRIKWYIRNNPRKWYRDRNS